MNITIIGCGNLGFSIAKGLANKQKEFNLDITATDPDVDLEKIRAIGINASRDNKAASSFSKRLARWKSHNIKPLIPSN